MELKNLIGKKLYKCGRATDMLWVSIGNPRVIEMPFANGEIKSKEVSDYAIHFQCPWRFAKDGEILLAAHDIYSPYDICLEEDDNWDWDVMKREKEERNIFDVTIEELSKKFLPLKIENIYFNETKDLHIDFAGGFCFDTFIATSRKQENYRIIDFTVREHTVIFDV